MIGNTLKSVLTTRLPWLLAGALAFGIWLSVRQTPVAHGATLTVTKAEDTDDGICDADCSLREAIAAASSGDTINIAGRTYTLTSELTISKNLTLTGEGADSTIIQAATQAGVATFRVFTIGGGSNTTISGVTIRHGNVPLGDGGGIQNSGTLILTNSVFSGNSAAIAAGITNYGRLTLTNGTVSGNIATSYGAILNTSVATLFNSTVSGNTSASGPGGGIVNQFGTVTLTNSTVSGNTATSDGGGIFNQGTLTLINGTISGNVAGSGGGILNTGTVTLRNTIVGGNTAITGPDCSGTLTSEGHNLTGNNAGCVFTRTTGDLVNVDPKLGPLQDNGGLTFTHALLPGSPAIDAGDDTICAAPVGAPNFGAGGLDQRGVGRPQGAHCDIGAYELELPIRLVIREDARPVSQTLAGIAQAEGKVTIHNGNPGLTNLRITVNGKGFEAAGLKDNEVRTVDVSTAMKVGSDNTITLEARGKPGGSATVVIHD